MGNIKDEVEVDVTPGGDIVHEGMAFPSISAFALVVLRSRNAERQACDGWKEVSPGGACRRLCPSSRSECSEVWVSDLAGGLLVLCARSQPLLLVHAQCTIADLAAAAAAAQRGGLPEERTVGLLAATPCHARDTLRVQVRFNGGKMEVLRKECLQKMFEMGEL